MEALAVADRVLPAVFFTDQRYARMSAEAKFVLLLLTSLSDKDGIAPCPHKWLAEHSDKEPNKLLDELRSWGHVTTYTCGREMLWAWLPWVSEHQPCRGNMRLARDPSRPPPPERNVRITLKNRWRRVPTSKELRSASPRTFGLKRSSIVADESIVAADGSPQALKEVWNKWRSYQRNPTACHLGPATKSMIERALKECGRQQLVDLLAYAYEADEAGPRYWRGENQQRRTYLGLDNLLRVNKLGGRVEMMQGWLERKKATTTTTACQGTHDGTDMGPLAAYRRSGPSGTISTPTNRPTRLSDQCERILNLLQDRGTNGVRTAELAAIALKYTGRISEIRGAGHDIYIGERCPDGNNLYILREREGGNGLDR